MTIILPTKRISKLEQLMKMAEVAALRSHDSETKVGCVLVDCPTDMALASACNGFAASVCDHRLPTTRPEKYQYIVHGEMNLLASCAKQGIRTSNKYVVCTMSPCCTCMRVLYQAGIEKVVIKQKYKDFESLKQMKDIKIEESITPEGYTVLSYTPRLPKIVFIGSNPSTKSPDDSAFHPDTPSGVKVREWTKGLRAEVHYLNVYNKKTLLNKRPSVIQTLDGQKQLIDQLLELEPDLIVSVGNTAKDAIEFLACNKFHMPHPSGLSRFWNNKEAGQEHIQALRDLISTV